MTFDTMKRPGFAIQSCCICGLINCDQAVDHNRVEYDQLKDIVLECKKEIPEIDELKFLVKNKFYQLKKELILMTKRNEESIMKWLDSFYFKHLENKILPQNVSIFCDILDNDLTRLPNRKLVSVMKISLKKRETENNAFTNLPKSISEDINHLLNSINIPQIVSQVCKQIKVGQIISRNKSSNQLSKSTDSVKTSYSTNSLNSSQVELTQKMYKYEWKHVKFTHNTKTVELNNRNITDEDMIKQLPIIATFLNIKELELRNNKITAFTCKVIASQLNFLSMLDLRGNNVGDEGVCKIATNLKGLKSLFVSETGITDKTGSMISSQLPDLQTLWSEHTKMTGQVCVIISQKPKLRLLSLVGNPISPQHKKIIQSIFRSKGYLNI